MPITDITLTTVDEKMEDKIAKAQQAHDEAAAEEIAKRRKLNTDEAVQGEADPEAPHALELQAVQAELASAKADHEVFISKRKHAAAQRLLGQAIKRKEQGKKQAAAGAEESARPMDSK